MPQITLGQLNLSPCRRNERGLSRLCTTQLCHTWHLRLTWQCAPGRLSSVALSCIVRVLVHKGSTGGWGRPCFSLRTVQERIVEFLWLSALAVLCLFLCRYIHFSHEPLSWCSKWSLSTLSGKHLVFSGGLHQSHMFL